ncbi:hypothetical protein LTR10_003602 [Elasticomyces elasticus]|nr:hypothetical protein LTR10_003602 [Elasticomyces elasticus]KAK4978205.1 hypothetical protein LTR42_002583 [Elasticomyces elasticus]
MTTKKRKTTQRKKTPARPSGTANSILYKLPAELRVSIFEFALIEDNKIIVSTALRLPSLLRVSSQVRDETVPIWYRGNTFRHPIVDCDADLMTKWNKHCYAFRFADIKTDVSIQGGPNWSNLVRWCELLCSPGRTVVLPADADYNELEQVISTATCIAERFWMKRRPWAECEVVLKEMRPLLGLYDDEWLK